MKTLLCSLNSKYIHSSLAVHYLAAGVDLYCKSDIDLTIMEGTINQQDSVILDNIVSHRPDLIAFSTYIWNITTIKRLLPILKNLLPDARILLGGPEVSYHPETVMMELPAVDYIICGEGELSFAAFLDCMAENISPHAVPALCYRQDGMVVKNPPDEVLPEPPGPYTDAYFRMLQGRIAYLETSRGCPFSCAFCLSGDSCGVRFFSLERAKQELCLLAGSGTQTVKLVDRTFNCNRNRAYELFRFLIERANGFPEGIRFHFEVAADLFDEETIGLLSSAPPGLFQFEAGIQSFNPATLAAVSRKTDTNKLFQNLQSLISMQNIHIHIDLIAGLPYETLESFIASFNTAYSLSPHVLQLGFLKLLHGSQLRAEADRYGYVYHETAPYEFVSNMFLTKEETQKLKRIEDALDRLYNSGRFAFTLQYLLGVMGLSPYELFSDFSEYLSFSFETTSVPLEEYTKAVFDLFSTAEKVDKTILRDVMVMDRIRCENTGKLPRCLRVEDDRLKQIVSILKASPPYRNKRFGAALLYSDGEKVIIADYTKKDPVTGHYDFIIQSL